MHTIVNKCIRSVWARRHYPKTFEINELTLELNQCTLSSISGIITLFGLKNKPIINFLSTINSVLTF